MPQYILVRLHPDTPTPGEQFTSYLADLTVTARDVSFANPQGVEIGQATYDSDQDESTIVQHFLPEPIPPLPFPIGPPVAQPVATAIIELDLPPGHPEHASVDLLLEVRRAARCSSAATPTSPMTCPTRTSRR
ncbi:MAG: hypothetical protein HC927_00485 [Deltaproteobacteria bacterium]|nr:hypothetical protein [Deltaproteobacteria bacterium]